MKYFLTFFLCTCCAFSLKAQKDPKVFEKVIKALSIPKSKIDTDLYNERILPYDNNTMVMVFPSKMELKTMVGLMLTSFFSI